ncbi:Rv3235 family protein [Streptomyces sp. NBC_00237]|uniref:Rv3235 family protein n=1 Tax=Streptomyces sp. NBC_00237 TaxID=2975687 RepID=UPI00225413FE|nr:Rv3235 family protein [Streptomyces sp. NBC_00237]MCX5200855.1 Rv3235 family protein [Streptomyces sp. NBC_00237]
MHRTTTRPGTTRRDTRGPGDSRGPGAAPQGAAARIRPHAPRTPQQQFAELLLAVLSGQRPAHSMLNLMFRDAYDQLVDLAPRAPFRTRGIRPVVRHCRGFSPRPGVIEASAGIGAGEQLRAMAFRLERSPDRRWRCTALELGGERVPARA